MTGTKWQFTKMLRRFSSYVLLETKTPYNVYMIVEISIPLNSVELLIIKMNQSESKEYFEYT